MGKGQLATRTIWLDYTKDLGWNLLGLCPSEIQNLYQWIEKCGGLIWSCCRETLKEKRVKKKRRKKGFFKLN